MGIHKLCEICGHVPTELTPELYWRWGHQLGKRVGRKSKFVVGGDVRLSTPQLMAALIDGLCGAGVALVDLGILPTPMVYYAKRRIRAAGCAVVTASHNPPDFNGLTWMLGDLPPTEDEVEQLCNASASGRVRRSATLTEPRTLDVSFDYVAWLQETFVDARGAQLTVVLDPRHGCLASRARRYLHAVFPRLVIETLHDAPDPVFDDHHPDCSCAEMLSELGAAVYRSRAQLGIAFDGDGDQVAFVNECGMPLGAEETTWLLLQSFGPQWPGQTFVYDLTFSQCVPKVARQLGAEPVEERSGPAFLRRRMHQTNALFGAEVHGHYYYRDLGGGDDGLYTACRMIAFLAQSGKRLAELERCCPPAFVTPDLRLPLPVARHGSVLRQLRRRWADRPQTNLDGVRICFPNGWALVRSEADEPWLSFRFEATNSQTLDKLVWQFCEGLEELGRTLWARYAEAMRG